MLRENYKKILNDMKKYGEYYKINDDIESCLDGNMHDVLRKHIQMLISDPEELTNTLSHITPINHLKKIVNKQSLLYSLDVYREANKNNDLMLYYAASLDVNTAFQDLSLYVNAQNCALMEYYQDDYLNIGLRALPATTFFVWTDDVVNPTKPKVYVKIIGTCQDPKNKYKLNALYFMYTDTEFLAVDSSGNIRNEYSTPNDINDLGFAPFVYVSKDKLKLIPTPNKDLLKVSLEIATIYSGASTAHSNQAWAKLILTDADEDQIQQIAGGTSSITVLKSTFGPNPKTPKFEYIASQLDLTKSTGYNDVLEKQIQYVNDVSDGGAAINESASGLALIIKSADMLENRKRQINLMTPKEKEFWIKLAKYHNYLVKTNMLNEDVPVQLFEPDFKITVQYQNPSVEQEQALANKNGTEVYVNEHSADAKVVEGDTSKESDNKEDNGEE